MSENYDTQVAHSWWLFFIMFEHVLQVRHLPWQFIAWWSQKWKKKVWRKRIWVTPYISYVLSCTEYISKHIHLILSIKFGMPSSYFLLFINALIRLLSTAHCILEPKVTKRYVQIMNICNPWLCWYILVHTCTYLYVLVHTIIQHHVLGIRLELPCDDVLSLLRVCCMLVPCIAHSILPFWGLFDGQASQAGLATPKLPQPQVDLIDIAAPPSFRCSSVGTAMKPESLLLLNMWGIVGVKLSARNNGIRGTLPTIFWTSVTSRQVGDDSYSLITLASSIGP